MTHPPQERHLARTVLICDDQPQVREALSDILSEDPSYEVVGLAHDAETCLQQLRDTRPDVLILDVNMPGGGPEMTQVVTQLAPSTYVLVYSARDDAETERMMMWAGAHAYVVKTGRLRPLLDALALAGGGEAPPSTDGRTPDRSEPS